MAAVCCFYSLIASAALLPDTLVAFPGAEGFGKYTSGGRGGKVVYVTNLEDDANGATVGSFRWALKQYPDEPITVCFAVTGEIRLVSEMRVKRNNYTIAGQTAPGLGIVITHNKVNLGSSENFIVQNIRFRVGQKNVNGDTITANAFGAENCNHFILDHCDFGWSTEENINTFDGHFFTIQYCIVHEGLYRAGHPKGDRGYGCQWGGSPASYHHNLLAHNNGRSCRFNGARNNDRVVYLDYINNVNFNYYGGSTACHGGENTVEDKYYNGKNSVHEVNFVNNYYIKGPNTTNKRLFFVADEKRSSGAASRGPSQWHVSGNVFQGETSATNNNWSAVTIKTYTADQARVDTLIRTKTPYWDCNADSTVFSGLYDFDAYAYAASDYQTAQDAFQRVLDTVGCFPRDTVERRLIRETRNNTYTYTGSNAKKKGIIDLETDAEGFIEYPQVVALTDTDLDGMLDVWEIANGCDPNLPDNNVRHASGYTMLEMYLHDAMIHKYAPVVPTAIQNLPVTDKAQKILRNGQIYILRGAKTYTLQGQVIEAGK
jgi:hypothetical protein